MGDKDMTAKDSAFMQMAIGQAAKAMNADKGGPFGAVIVKNGKVVAKSHNKVTSKNDPTAHAEVEVIRAACKKLNTYDLSGCILYTSCEPCPMCFGAIYWARLEKVFYACKKEDAADIGFDDGFIYEELEVSEDKRAIPFCNVMRGEALQIFRAWEEKEDRLEY